MEIEDVASYIKVICNNCRKVYCSGETIDLPIPFSVNPKVFSYVGRALAPGKIPWNQDHFFIERERLINHQFIDETLEDVTHLLNPSRVIEYLPYSESACLERSSDEGGQASFIQDIYRIVTTISEFNSLGVEFDSTTSTYQRINRVLAGMLAQQIAHCEECVWSECINPELHPCYSSFGIREPGYKMRVVNLPQAPLLFASEPVQKGILEKLSRTPEMEKSLDANFKDLFKDVASEEAFYSSDFSKATDNVYREIPIRVYENILNLLPKEQSDLCKLSLMPCRIVREDEQPGRGNIRGFTYAGLTTERRVPVLSIHRHFPNIEFFIRKHPHIEVQTIEDYINDVHYDKRNLLRRIFCSILQQKVVVERPKEIVENFIIKHHGVSILKSMILYYRMWIKQPLFQSQISTRGINMSLPLSFPLLCGMNIVACRRAAMTARIMGDDMLSHTKQDNINIYNQIVEKVFGFVLNRDKSYIGNRGLFCEQFFETKDFSIVHIPVKKIKGILLTGKDVIEIWKDVEPHYFPVRFYSRTRELERLYLLGYNIFLHPSSGGLNLFGKNITIGDPQYSIKKRLKLCSIRDGIQMSGSVTHFFTHLHYDEHGFSPSAIIKMVTQYTKAIFNYTFTIHKGKKVPVEKRIRSFQSELEYTSLTDKVEENLITSDEVVKVRDNLLRMSKYKFWLRD